MPVDRTTQDRILLIVAIAAACSIHLSIALSQILLGAGILLFLVFRQKLYFPRIWIPLALFFFWTALADVLSPDPWGGRAQIRKFFVFFFIPLIYGVFREQFRQVFWLLAAWAAAATASGAYGIFQFASKYRHAHRTGEDFYVTYVGHRITGFESHWMTFGALQLSVFSLLLAQLLFSNRKLPAWSYIGIPVLFTAILLGETRSIWLATLPALIYLLWFWRPKMVFAVPVIIAAAFLAAPNATRQRFDSIWSPHGETDSNRHRFVTFVTGVQMVKAHPWFGIGPEQIRRQFESYVPPYVQRPLPVGYYGHLHNIYVQYAAERGLPGLAAIMGLIALTLTDCLRAIRKLDRRPCQELFVLHGVVAVILGILVGGMFEYNLGDSEVLMMFASVVALGYAAAYRVNSSDTGAYPRAPAEFQSAANPALYVPQPSSRS